MEWEVVLPSVGDLIPLSQSLISPELASAFGISLPYPTTCSTTRPIEEPGSGFEILRLFPECHNESHDDSKIPRTIDPMDCGGGSGFDEENSVCGGDENGSASRGVKRPRLVWTPQLHKRFVDVIEHLGVEKAVPKTIMEMMNVEDLTRENVASHLQKYRLYLKRMERVSPGELSSSSNPRSASTQSLYDFYGGNGGGYGQTQPSVLHCNSMNMMPIHPLSFLSEVGVRRYGYGGGGGGGPLRDGYCW